jgi:hypothetical protein
MRMSLSSLVLHLFVCKVTLTAFATNAASSGGVCPSHGFLASHGARVTHASRIACFTPACRRPGVRLTFIRIFVPVWLGTHVSQCTTSWTTNMLPLNYTPLEWFCNGTWNYGTGTIQDGCRTVNYCSLTDCTMCSALELQVQSQPKVDS